MRGLEHPGIEPGKNSVAKMNKIWLSIACFVLVSTVPCDGQETPSAETAPEPPQSKTAAARPSIPRDILIESSAGAVQFPHKGHLKYGCKKCHHQIQASELDTPHPEYLTSSWINCQDCHKAEQENGNKYYKCSACHHSDPATISDETLSSKVVTHKSCWNCHETGTGVNASKGCGDCHMQEEA